MRHTYPGIEHPQNDAYFTERCILCARNKDVRDINALILDTFPGPVHELWAVDKAVDPDDPQNMLTSYTPEFLHSLTPSGFPPALLKIKLGSPIIVL